MPSTASRASGISFEGLMGISPGDFARTYWRRAYCYAKGGPEQIHAVFGGPWSLPEWRAATERAYRWPGSPRTLQALPKSNQDRSKFLYMPPEQVDAALASGSTIIGDVLDARLSTLAAALKGDLSITGPVSTYASLSGAGEAAAPHYDGSHVFILQLEGRKRWRISPSPAVINPSRGRRISSDAQIDSRPRLEDETRVEQISVDNLDNMTLEPGDMLYVPAGTVHATEALERSLSVMINFGPPRFDALVELIVRRTLCADAEWRGLPAAGPDGAHRDHVNEGLQRVRDILSGLDADSPAVRAAWNEMTANIGDLQSSFAAAQRPERAISINVADRLRLNSLYPVRYSERIDPDGELRLTVYLGQEQISDSGAGAELLRNIVERAEFVAGEARYWSGDTYDWDVVRAYLESLVLQGLLTAV